jgi:hypothetical protein
VAHESDAETNWEAVIARSLAFLCLNASDVRGSGLLEEAGFLMTLGLRRADAAALLGSTDDSLRVTIARAQRSAGAKASATKGKAGASRRGGA